MNLAFFTSFFYLPTFSFKTIQTFLQDHFIQTQDEDITSSFQRLDRYELGQLSTRLPFFPVCKLLRRRIYPLEHPHGSKNPILQSEILFEIPAAVQGDEQ